MIHLRPFLVRLNEDQFCLFFVILSFCIFSFLYFSFFLFLFLYFFLFSFCLHLHSFLVGHNSDEFCGELLDLVLLLAGVLLQHRVLLQQPQIPDDEAFTSSIMKSFLFLPSWMSYLSSNSSLGNLSTSRLC